MKRGKTGSVRKGLTACHKGLIQLRRGTRLDYCLAETQQDESIDTEEVTY
jgi:hypothetical protein